MSDKHAVTLIEIIIQGLSLIISGLRKLKAEISTAPPNTTNT